MYCKISVVYSSHLGEDNDRKFEKMLYETSGLSEEQLEILRYENYNQFSLAKVYNIGLKESNYPVVLFIHNDTRFVKENWGITLLDKFNSSDYGILGLAGTNKMMNHSESGEKWLRDASHMAGFVYHPDGSGGMEENRFSNKLNFIVPAVSVDGVFIAVAKERLALGFDEDFKGFHFYDISFCVRNFEKGVKVGIISDFSVVLYHNSKGCFEKEWDKSRIQFINKYKRDYYVPVKLDIPETHFDFEKSEQQNRVHIIILTKDKINLLFQCLNSIIETTIYPFFSVWVADTGSSVENIELIKKKIRELNERSGEKYGVLSSTSNKHFNLIKFDYYNFSKVNNEVVRILERSGAIKGNDFLLFCNNDVQLLNDCVGGCIDAYQNYNRNGLKVGTIGIRLHFEDNTIQHCGMLFTNNDHHVRIDHKYYSSVYQYIDKTEKCIGNTGAFMFTPYSTFKNLGMFNEKYFEIYQDAEYNLNCTLKGYTNIFVGNLVAYHFESQTRRTGISGRTRQIRKDEDDTFFPFLIKNHRKLLNVKRIVAYNNNASRSRILTLQVQTVRTGPHGLQVNAQSQAFASVIERYLQERQQKPRLFGENVWTPLISGDSVQKIDACLKNIAATLRKNHEATKSLGLYFGETGISMFLFNYFRLTHNSDCENLAYEILESVTSQLGRSMNRSFFDGLCGICWYIEYLAQNQFIANNTKELLSAIDRFLKNPISALLDFRLSSGWVSYGMYFLSRIKNSGQSCPRHRKMLNQIALYLEDFLPENAEEADEPENLTMMQGYLGIIPFLCQLYKITGTPHFLEIINKYIDFILQQEKTQPLALRFPNQVRQGTCYLQWNSGDLSVANVLLQAATVSNNKEWEIKALEIALRTTLIKEPGVSMDSTFSGTAGIAHLYNRLYQHYQLPELRDASIFWIDRTLGVLENQRAATTEYGLLNGLAGTGLVLMSAISETKPTWDSALLIN